MWHIQLQSLKSLCLWFKRRCIYKKIHYFTFDLGVKVTWNVAQYPLHHVTNTAAKFETATSNGLGGDVFTRKRKCIIWPWPRLWVKVTWNVAQYPLHRVTNISARFGVATSNGLGRYAFTRKYIIWPLTLTFDILCDLFLGSSSHKMLTSTLYIRWPMQL